MIVDSLWAMTNDVRFSISVASASCTSSSASVSSADVASSRIRIGAFFNKRARDREALPLPARQFLPALPDARLVLSGRTDTNSCACAARDAASISAGVARAAPYAMLLAIVSSKSTVS